MGIAPKNPLKSKTIWLNTISTLIALGGVFFGQEFIKDNAMLVCIGGLILGVLNVVLRFITDAPLSWDAGSGGITYIKLLLIGLVVGGACAPSSAEDIAVVLDTTPKSYLVTIDAKGNASAIPLKGWVRPGPAPPPAPPTPPTPTPPPSPLNDRAKAMNAVALTVTRDPNRATTAVALAALYRNLGAMVRTSNPAIPDKATLAQAINIGTNALLIKQDLDYSNKGPWQPVRDLLSLQWSAIIGPNNQPAPLADYATLLDDAVSGLLASSISATDNSATDKGFDQALLDFIEKVLIPLIIAVLNLKH